MAFPAWAQVMGVCGVYMMVGPSLMVLNKDIMDPHGSIHFPYPFLLSSLGLLFTSAVTHSMHLAGVLELPSAKIVTRRFWLRNILPVGACHAATLSFGNAQYLYMGIALIQFLKAFTPMVVALFTLLLLGKQSPPEVWLALALTSFGTSLTAVGDMNLSIFGIMLALGSSSTEAIRLVLTQFALQDCKFTLLEGQYFLAPAGALCLLCVSVVFEFSTIIENGDFYKFHLYPFQFFFAGSLGLAVQLVTSSVIQLTSSTALKVLSQFRNAAVVLTGVMLYGEIVTAMQAFGYILSLVGIAAYTRLQQRKG